MLQRHRPVGVLRRQTSVPVRRHFALIIIPDLRDLQALVVITHCEHDLICHKLLFHQL